MKYKKKPIVVDAIQYNGLNLEELKSFVGEQLIKYSIIDTIWDSGRGIPHLLMEVKTNREIMMVCKNDYIIKNTNGEFSLSQPYIFEQTYDIVEE